MKGQKIRICVIGCGQFSQHFIPLFLCHQNVEKVAVCDIIPERAEEYAKRFNVERIASFEDAISREDINAVAIFAPRHLHGPLAINALKAGKNVYSAVPMASKVEDCAEIIKLVKEKNLVYMMGETCIYYPCSMFCKKAYERGEFGKFVYGEAQYHHDLLHFGVLRNDMPTLAIPPLYYSTHSVSMLLYALNEHVTRVTAVGYVDTEPDTPYTVGGNQWDNVYSNEYSLMQLSGGATIRINECRRIGYKAPSSYISAFYGTQGAYQFTNAQHIVTHLTEEGVTLDDVSEEVNPIEMTKHVGEPKFKEQVANHVWQTEGISPVQTDTLNSRNLPKEYMSIPGGHMNSHRLLIDDFCTAVYNKTVPTVDAWRAARFTIPGLIAHESATHENKWLSVPDFGDTPKDYLK